MRSANAASDGIRFQIIAEQERIRPHIRCFVGREIAHALDHPLRPGDEVEIVCALSRGGERPERTGQAGPIRCLVDGDARGAAGAGDPQMAAGAEVGWAGSGCRT